MLFKKWFLWDQYGSYGTPPLTCIFNYIAHILQLPVFQYSKMSNICCKPKVRKDYFWNLETWSLQKNILYTTCDIIIYSLNLRFSYIRIVSVGNYVHDWLTSGTYLHVKKNSKNTNVKKSGTLVRTSSTFNVSFEI